MIQLYQKLTHLKVLARFFDCPEEEFYLRELARLLDMSPMTVKRALDMLVGDGFIIRAEVKNHILYRANTENPAFRFAKISYNLTMLEDLIDTIVRSAPSSSSIVLYGSHAKGENDEHSDLDILIISPVKGFDEIESDIPVNILTFTDTEWTKHAKDNRAFYLDVITEGIVLHGTRPVVE